MEFSDNKPIYRQIADHACDMIIGGKWTPGMRVPSVRELAVELGVNTRTVLKAMEELQDSGIIFPRRGLGYILTEDAPSKVRESMRREFFGATLPRLASEMRLLGISPDEIRDALMSLS
ncbi:MAG: GntR family transcriptional regulator [Bacteroides sp.]|nr:GntR family transcriptional regulator [Bacteroidales bacterium]MBD5292050.1 GntR family transcriptional regulator [Bacteroides sp.]MBD5339602.1 GntR family transcriptional regulator [Bacteroides sp.]